MAVLEPQLGNDDDSQRVSVLKAMNILHLKLHREYFARVADRTKRIEYRKRSQYWKRRLENRKYDVISFRNGYATRAPEMLVEFGGVRRIKKWGKSQYAIRLGRILKIKRWKK